MSAGSCELPELLPVFPLSEVVLFPNQFLQLHIFEPRYRAMTTEALESHKLIAMALLKPGFEEQYYTHHAPIEPVVGVGRIMACENLDGGKFNILLRGVARAAIINEAAGRPYRCAKLQPFPAHSLSQARVAELRRSLQETLQRCSNLDCDLYEQWKELFDSSLGVGDLVDLIAGTLPAPADVRQTLLAEPDPTERATLLVEHLKTICAVAEQRSRQAQRGNWTVN